MITILVTHCNTFVLSGLLVLDHYKTILTVIVSYRLLSKHREAVIIQTFGNRERGVVYTSTNIFTKFYHMIFYSCMVKIKREYGFLRVI